MGNRPPRKEDKKERKEKKKKKKRIRKKGLSMPNGKTAQHESEETQGPEHARKLLKAKQRISMSKKLLTATSRKYKE